MPVTRDIFEIFKTDPVRAAMAASFNCSRTFFSSQRSLSGAEVWLDVVLLDLQNGRYRRVFESMQPFMASYQQGRVMDYQDIARSRSTRSARLMGRSCREAQQYPLVGDEIDDGGNTVLWLTRSHNLIVSCAGLDDGDETFAIHAGAGMLPSLQKLIQAASTKRSSLRPRHTRAPDNRGPYILIIKKKTRPIPPASIRPSSQIWVGCV